MEHGSVKGANAAVPSCNIAEHYQYRIGVYFVFASKRLFLLADVASGHPLSGNNWLYKSVASTCSTCEVL